VADVNHEPAPSSDNAAHQPPSRRIADELRRAIKTGAYQPGDKLPSSRDLAQTYATARNTASEALRILESEGLVDAQHGRGVFVRRQRPLMRLGSNRYSRRLRDESGLSPFLLEASRQGWAAHVEGRSVDRVQPPIEIAERLNVSASTKSVVRRENWYFAEGEPVQFALTYIPWAMAKGTALAKVGEPIPTGIYAYLESFGHAITQAREEISSRMPTPEESRDLRVPPGVPVIEVLHTSIDQDQVPFDVTRFVLRADVMGLDYLIPVED
jgi:GntR family transcriptional regulator